VNDPLKLHWENYRELPTSRQIIPLVEFRSNIS